MYTRGFPRKTCWCRCLCGEADALVLMERFGYSVRMVMEGSDLWSCAGMGGTDIVVARISPMPIASDHNETGFDVECEESVP